MLMPLLILALIGFVGIFAALRPEAYTRYFLAQSQRKALSGNLKAVSLIGWLIFGGCVVIILAIPFQSTWTLLAPVVGPLFFLVCAVAYIWWGIGLLHKPESFLERASDPLSRLPPWVVKGFGSLLLLGAVGFLYGFAVRMKELFR